MKIINKNTTTINKTILFNLLKELGYENIEAFQTAYNLVVDGEFGPKSYNILYKKLLNVVDLNFENYYFKDKYEKKQIIWHHSAGWDNARGMFDWWKADGKTHVATAIGITDNGVVTRGFDEDYWAASIGCGAKVFIDNGVPLKHVNGVVVNNTLLDQHAVAVEVCNWGNLTESNGKYYSWSKTEIPKDKVIELNYKGFKYFETYTKEECSSLMYWTLLCAIKYNIPLNFSYDDMFSVSKKALSGTPGLYTHNSYRSDKTDVSPQQCIIDIAKKLELYMK